MKKQELQCRSTKYFNFKSVVLGVLFALTLRKSPQWQQASIQTFWFNKLIAERSIITLCHSGVEQMMTYDSLYHVDGAVV